MKKLSIFAVTIAALAFTACGGNKNQQATEQTEESLDFQTGFSVVFLTVALRDSFSPS